MELPNNSEKALAANQTEHRVEKVVKGEVKRRQTFGKMIRDSFVPEDVENAGTYILSEMVVPGIRDGVFDILMGIIDYWRGGVGGTSRRRSGNSQPSRIRSMYDYGSKFRGGVQEPREVRTSKYCYDDIVVGSRAEAEEVLASLKDIIRVYSVARVADLFDLVGVSGSYTDNNFGWTNLDNADYKRVSGGWLLIFPKAMPIED